MTISQLQSPPPYSGDTIAALATVSVASSKGGTVAPNISYGQGQLNGGLVKAGDQIQLGLQGAMYTVTSGSGGTAASLDVSQGLSVPWGAGSMSVPFKVLRQPVKSNAAAVQLPSPAAIDLTFSGPDMVSASQQPVFWGGAAGDTSPIQIMFAAGRHDRPGLCRGPGNVIR